jgi:5S rRNA maturation endonuclease (ribonuclease M5)
MSGYTYILESNNPDKDLEFFWLTYVKDCDDYRNRIEKRHIISLSEKLNKLQKEKKYDSILTDIDNYMIRVFPIIGWRVMAEGDLYKLGHISDNFKRWETIRGRPFESNKITKFYTFLEIMIVCSRKMSSDTHKEIRLLCSEYANMICLADIDEMNDKIRQIVNKAIEYKMTGVITRLMNIYDITPHLNNEEDLGMRIEKLVKKLKIIN